VAQISLQEQLGELNKLQKIDKEIQTLTKKKNELPIRLKELDSNLRKIKQKLEEKDEVFSALDKQKKQNEAALDLTEDRIKRATEKTDAVTNDKEFQAVSRESEQLKKQKTTIEEQLQGILEKWETLKTEMDVLRESFNEINSQREEQKNLLAKESKVFDDEIIVFQKNQQEYLSKIDKRLLAKYNRVKVARQGIGITNIISGQCQGCHMMIPAQMANTLRRGEEIVTCPYCQRILCFTEDQVASENGVLSHEEVTASSADSQS